MEVASRNQSVTRQLFAPGFPRYFWGFQWKTRPLRWTPQKWLGVSKPCLKANPSNWSLWAWRVFFGLAEPSPVLCAKPPSLETERCEVHVPGMEGSSEMHPKEASPKLNRFLGFHVHLQGHVNVCMAFKLIVILSYTGFYDQMQADWGCLFDILVAYDTHRRVRQDRQVDTADLDAACVAQYPESSGCGGQSGSALKGLVSPSVVCFMTSPPIIVNPKTRPLLLPSLNR